jgi:uncharacterized secreted protein with C-terminal beta-propeller domain
MRKLWTSLAIATLLFTACGREAGPGGVGSTGAHDPHQRSDIRAAIRAASTTYSLERFDACGPLLEHLRSEALKRVGPWGLPGTGGGRGVALEATAGRAAADTAAAPAAPDAFSGTNVQEANVDEPDVVKTDGRHLFTVRPVPGDQEGRQLLTSISIEDGSPSIADDLMLPQGNGYQLLVAGDRLLAIGQKGGYAIAVDMDARMGMPAPGDTGTVIAVIDIADRAAMRITQKLELDGFYVSTRMIDGVARLVLNSESSAIPFEQPTEPTVDAQRATLAANKAKIEKSTVEDWLPHFTLADAAGKVTSEGTLATCDSTFHPKTFSGFGEMSVVTIDPNDPDPRNSATVIGAASTVYASTSNLYVATQEWPQPKPFVLSDQPVGAPEVISAPAKSVLHRFDIADPQRAVYAASGEVRGIVLNQWSMSEHEGFLRVATTEDRFQQNQSSSSSFVNVLDARADKLTKVAGIDDISPGERIYGVRFMGDTGYMVTFKQIDPLHVIDLSDPRSPKLRGELKIPGYSAYLHPVGDGLLLGVGRDADLEGRPLGVSVSLFDVRDPAAPKRLAVERLNDTYTQIEYDHHAFTWWEPERLALIPVELQNVIAEPVSPDGREIAPDKQLPTSYLYSFRVTDGGLTKVGRLTHGEHTQQYTGQITRSIVVGDTLYSLSGAGVAASDLGTFAERAWLPLS